MTRVVIYSRVSTDAQERDGTSLDTQEAACLQFAENRGWQLVDAIRESASGGTLSRPGLERARDLLRRRKADILLAYSVDRLSRELTGVMIVLAESEEYGYKLEFVQEKFENSAIGRLILSVRAFSAEDERGKIIERTSRGKVERAKSGRLPQATGKGCFGYVYDPASGRRVENAEQALVIRRMFSGVLAGASVSGLCRLLNDTGVPAFGGGRWHPRTVRNVLTNETYTGVTVFRRTKATTVRDVDTGKRKRQVIQRERSEWIDVPNASPALISKSEFAQVQAILNDPERKRRGKRSQVYKLSGRIRCGECQSPATGQTLQKGRYVYYRCRDSYNPHTTTECDAQYIPRDSLEAAVFDALVAVLTDSSRLDDEIRRAVAADEPAGNTSELERELKSIEEKQRRLVQAYLNPDLPQDALAAEAKRLSQRKLALETELSELQRGNVGRDSAAWLSASPAITEHVRNWVAQARDADLDLLLQALDVRVTATKVRAVIELTVVLARLVQMLNLVTTARTSASQHARSLVRRCRSRLPGGRRPGSWGRSFRGRLSR